MSQPCGLGEGIAVDVLAQVTEKMREGLARMRVFFDDPSKAHLEEGSRTFFEGSQMVYQVQRIGETAQRLYDNLTGIQWGRLPDPFGWTDLLPQEE